MKDKRLLFKGHKSGSYTAGMIFMSLKAGSDLKEVVKASGH